MEKGQDFDDSTQIMQYYDFGTVGWAQESSSKSRYCVKKSLGDSNKAKTVHSDSEKIL